MNGRVLNPVEAAMAASQQHQQMQQALNTDIAHFQRLLYVQLVTPYLLSLDPALGPPDNDALKAIAEVAKKAILPMYEAQGVIKIQEPIQW